MLSSVTAENRNLWIQETKQQSPRLGALGVVAEMPVAAIAHGGRYA